MDLLRASTITLLASVDPEQLTIREISDHAGVFHRYIPDYFGGKAELFADVYPTILHNASGPMNLNTSAIKPELVRAARLAVWLSANRPDGVPDSDHPIYRTIINTLNEFTKLDEATAILLAERLVAGVVVLAAFPDVVKRGPIDIAAHAQLEQRIIRLLAQDTSN
jgi:AcrR family transcriptional regulator